jgi:hypothetical protein
MHSVSRASEFSSLSIIVYKITTVLYGVNELLRSVDSVLADRRKRIFVQYGFFICLLIYDLLNDVISSSDCLKSSGRALNKY